MPTSKPLYTITFPKGQTLNFETNLQKSLRWTLRLLADDILNRNDSNAVSDTKCYAKMLETLAKQIDDKHYETYEVIGKYYHKTGDFEKTLKKYKKSLDLLNKDSKISRTCMQWKPVFTGIEETVWKLESGLTTSDQIRNVGTDVCATMATNSPVKISE